MGCDYYIVKLLCVSLDVHTQFTIELEREQGYYDIDYDEDEEDYEEQCNEYKKMMLTPGMKPIMVYQGGDFRSIFLATKYKSIVENELNVRGKKWSDVREIIKVERRYER